MVTRLQIDMLKIGDMIPIVTNYLQSAAHKRSPKDFIWASSSILEEMIAHLVTFWHIQYLLMSVEFESVDRTWISLGPVWCLNSCLNHYGLKMPVLPLRRKTFGKLWILLTCPIFDACRTTILPNLFRVPRMAMHPVFTGSLPSSEFKKTRPFA
jgi:hypothetical protein